MTEITKMYCRNCGKGYADLVDGRCVEIEEAFHQTWLKPKHALAFRDWLIQESAELEQMAKEQGS